MEQIPTAKEFCRKRHNESDPTISWIDFNEMVMIEFAKMHVEAALKAKIEAMYEKQNKDSSYSIDELDACTEDCYPLSNIK